MDKPIRGENQTIETVLEQLNILEKRISRLEKISALPYASLTSQQHEDLTEDKPKTGIEPRGIEYTLGEYGMAWLGNIVLLFGIIFLLQFLKSQGFALLSSVFGFAAVAGVYYTSRLISKSFPYMSNLFNYNGHILLFIVVLRLHFTASDPLIPDKFIGLFLLVAVIIRLLYLAYRNKSQVLTSIVILLMVITAILGNSAPFMLSLMVIIAAFSVYFVHKYSWWKLLMLSVFFVYSTFLLWILNNPFITHSIKAVESLQYGYIYLFACAFIYSMLALLPNREKDEGQMLNVSIILNGLGFSFIIGMIVLKFFKDNYYFPLCLISAFGIAYSALLQSKGQWKISAALYALYGFALLSITLSGIYKFPIAFQLLAFQSLLVLSMSLWFRSRFIVLMNVVMFIGLLIAYFIFPKPSGMIDFSFALIALISARVINWQRDRLEIKTEWMRNIYLISGFIMTLVSLYRAVPFQYVTLSWSLAAGTFFILSLLLRNMKYRWLAISAMIVTVVYFFMFDLRHVSIGYRIVALLFLALISLSFSTYYSKRIKNKNQV